MKSRRRAANEGSAFKRKSDGRWCGSLSEGWKGGRRKRICFYGPTQAAVLEQMTAAKERRRKGVPVKDDGRSVSRLLEEYLTSIKSSVRVRTFEKYRDTVYHHLIPTLGRVSIQKLTRNEVEKLLEQKLAAGLHPRTVQGIKQVLRYALDLDPAMKDELLSRNVAALVGRPKVPALEMSVWTGEQARQFLAACSGEPLEALYSRALFCGCRRGEILALRWSDIDLDAGLLSVHRNLQRTRTQGLVFEEPKTKKGRRSIPLAAPVIASLRAHRKRQAEKRLAAGPEWQDQGLAFCTGIGTPLDPRDLGIDYDRMIRKARVPRINFHSLRHTFATMGLSANINPKVMADMLGHARVAITLDIYSHVPESAQVDAISAIADALANAR